MSKDERIVKCFRDYSPREAPRDGLKHISNLSDPSTRPWLSLDLIASLLRLGNSIFHSRVRQLFDFPMEHIPDLLMLSLAFAFMPDSVLARHKQGGRSASVTATGENSANATLQATEEPNSLQEELMLRLVPVFMNEHANAAPVLQRVLALHPNIVCSGIIQWYRQDPTMDRLDRAFVVARDIKAITYLIESTDYDFVFDLAIHSSRKEFMNVPRWLEHQLGEQNDALALGCLHYLQRKTTPQRDGLPKLEPLLVNTLVEVIDSANNLSLEVQKKAHEFRKSNPDLMISSIPPLSQPNLPELVMPNSLSDRGSDGDNSKSPDKGAVVNRSKNDGSTVPLSSKNDASGGTSNVAGANIVVEQGVETLVKSLPPLSPQPSFNGRAPPLEGTPQAQDASLQPQQVQQDQHSQEEHLEQEPAQVNQQVPRLQQLPLQPPTASPSHGPDVIQFNDTSVESAISEPIPHESQNNIQTASDVLYSMFRHTWRSYLLGNASPRDVLHRLDELNAMHLSADVWKEFLLFVSGSVIQDASSIQATYKLFCHVINHNALGYPQLTATFQLFMEWLNPVSPLHMFRLAFSIVKYCQQQLSQYPGFLEKVKAAYELYQERNANLLSTSQGGAASANITPPLPSLNTAGIAASPSRAASDLGHLHRSISSPAQSCRSMTPQHQQMQEQEQQQRLPALNTSRTTSLPGDAGNAAAPSSTYQLFSVKNSRHGAVNQVVSSSANSQEHLSRPSSTLMSMFRREISSINGSSTNGGQVGFIPSLDENDSSINNKFSSFTSFSGNARGGSSVNEPSAAAKRSISLMPVLSPSEKFRTRVSFMFNGMNDNTVSTVIATLNEQLEHRHYTWFAKYLVEDRAASEADLHKLYARVYAGLLQGCRRAVLDRTYFHCTNLLHKFSTTEANNNAQDRTRLKNMGSWLGYITLSQNLPVVATRIAFPHLIKSAYHRDLVSHQQQSELPTIEQEDSTKSGKNVPGKSLQESTSQNNASHPISKPKKNREGSIESNFTDSTNSSFDVATSSANAATLPAGKHEWANMTYTIAFVCKVLEGCKRSRVFRRTQPWIKEQFSLLNEVHDRVSRSSVQFDIELLFRQVDARREDFPTSNILADIKPTTTLFSNGLRFCMTAGDFTKYGLTPAEAVIYRSLVPNRLETMREYVVVPRNLQQCVSSDIDIQDVLQSATHQAVADALPAAQSRSIRVAIATSHRTITKDFVNESDLSFFRSTALAMAQKFASGLAQVTSRESIFKTMKPKLKSQLEPHLNLATLAEKESVIDEAITLQLPVCSVFFKISTCEVVEPYLDFHFSRDYEARKSRTTGPYCDVQVPLPAPLQPPASNFFERASSLFSVFGLPVVHSDTPSSPSANFPVGDFFPSFGSNSANLDAPLVMPQSSQQQKLQVKHDQRPQLQWPKPGSASPEGTINDTHGTPNSTPNRSDSSGQSMQIHQATQSPTNVSRASENLANKEKNRKQQQMASQIQSAVALQPFTMSAQSQSQPQTKANKQTIVASARTGNQPGSTDWQVLRKTLLLQLDKLVAEIIHEPQNQQHTCLASGLRDYRAQLGPVSVTVQTQVLSVLAEDILARLFDKQTSRETVLKDVYVQVMLALRDWNDVFVDYLSRHYEPAAQQYNQAFWNHIGNLLCLGLLSPACIDSYFLKLMESAHSSKAIAYVQNIIYQVVIQSKALPTTDFPKSIAKLKAAPTEDESQFEFLSNLDALKKQEDAAQSAAMFSEDMLRDAEEAGRKKHYVQRTLRLYNEWASIYWQNRAPHDAFLQKLANIMLITEKSAAAFFSVAVDVSLAKSSGLGPWSERSFAIDCFYGLFASALHRKYVSETIFAYLLPHIARILVVDYQSSVHPVPGKLHCVAAPGFDQRPYHSLVKRLVSHLHPRKHPFDAIGGFLSFLTTTAPNKLEYFVFPWLELLSDRTLIPTIMAVPESRSMQEQIASLIAGLLRYLAVHIQAQQLSEPIQQLCNAAIRVLRLLGHDYPAFVSEFATYLVRYVPPSSPALQNAILFATPSELAKRMQLSIWDHNMLDINPPAIFYDYTKVIGQQSTEFDAYFNRLPAEPVPKSLLLACRIDQSPDNFELLCAISISAGGKLLQQLTAHPSVRIEQLPGFVFFCQLVSIDRFDFVYNAYAAMATHLRFPNPLTYTYLKVFVTLYRNVPERSREILLRVIVQRAISRVDAPWGISVLMLKLCQHGNLLSLPFVAQSMLEVLVLCFACCFILVRLWDNLQSMSTSFKERYSHKASLVFDIEQSIN